MSAGQWLGLILVVAMIVALAWAYWRKGTSIKPDDSRRTEDWPRTTQGGSS